MNSKHWMRIECALAVLAVVSLITSLVTKSAELFGFYCGLLFTLFVAELIRVEHKWNEYFETRRKDDEAQP